MTHYEERLERDLKRIRDRVLAIGSRVEGAVEKAMKALRTLDRDLAYETILEDLKTNRWVVENDRLCHAFVARHLPSAGHLRFVSSVMRMNIALERVGDYAVTVCRETIQLSAVPSERALQHATLLAEEGAGALNEALQAFELSSADRALATKELLARTSHEFRQVFDDLVAEAEAETRPIEDLFALLVVFNRLERISDQAKNLCEEVVFTATGETKEPKVYRILFVDEDGARAAPLAAALARKAFPDYGEYQSAGLSPRQSLDGQFLAFCEKLGIDPGVTQPLAFEPDRQALSHYHVVVSLVGDLTPRLTGRLPFHTVLLHWQLDNSVADSDEPAFEAAARELSARIGELFEALRGIERE